MHILLVHQAFAALDEAGGTRHYELARYLVQRGHQVTIIASPVNYLSGKARGGKIHWLEKQQPEAGITILRTFTLPALHRSFFHRILTFFSFMFSSFWVGLGVPDVDLVWGTSPPIFQGITAWLLARLKDARFLFEVRDLWPAFAIEVGVLRNPMLIRLSLWLEHFLYTHADRILVNSPGFIDHLTAKGAHNICLIPNGADVAMFDPQADGRAFREEQGLAGKFIVLYAGAHGLSNDLGVVIAAAALLRDELDVMFVLVGDGKDKPKLQAQAQEQGLRNIRFVAPVAKNNMAEVIAAADACLAILKPIELYKTTYPNKVFDYMAAGRPVVLAIDGVIRTVVEDAGAGFFVQPGNPQSLAQAVRLLTANPTAARAMGLKGSLYVQQHFNRADLAEQLAVLLEGVVGAHE